MSIAKVLHLEERDHVVAAWAESASGPGYRNSPLWVLVRSQLDGVYRVECLQPSEQTNEMMMLYAVSQVAHLEMTDAVRRACMARK